MTDEIRNTITDCWYRGDSIADTKQRVKYAHNVQLSFDDIHPVFVKLSHGENVKG